jgi:malate dehydrogenase (oxaloacetate-decarboxylating)(NADP+)
VFAAATGSQQQIAYAEGEDERILRAVQTVVDERLARPLLIGRPAVVERKIRELGLRLKLNEDFKIADPTDDALTDALATDYYSMLRRRGLSREDAYADMQRNNTLIAASLLRRGDVDGLLCGVTGTYAAHLKPIRDVIGLRDRVSNFAAMHLLMLQQQNVFVCDTYINVDPNTEQIAEITLLAADAVRHFGVPPRVALLSHSSFGNSDAPSAVKMREALELIRQRDPTLEVDGEMHADAALSKSLLDRVLPNSRLSDSANLLVMPNLDAASITFNALKIVAGSGVTVGPVLLGSARPAHILTPMSSVRRIVNMTALTAVHATNARQLVTGSPKFAA